MFGAVRAGLAAAALGGCLALPAAAAVVDDCDPAVERALVENAEVGARDDVRIVRHPDYGVRDPESLFDLSCVTDMFNYKHSDILFRPDRAMTDVLGLLRRFVCDRARDAYRGFVGRRLDATMFGAEVPRLPGLDVGVEWGNLLDDVGDRSTWNPPSGETRSDPSSLPAPGVFPTLPAGEPGGSGAPSSRPGLLRSLLGGGDEAEDRK